MIRLSELTKDHYRTGEVAKLIGRSPSPDKFVEQELAEDIISIIESFSGKLYGMRHRVKDHVDDILSS